MEKNSSSNSETEINFTYKEVTEEEWKQEEEQLRKRYGNLRKSVDLEKLPFEEWTKEELLNLIDEYDIYFIVLSGLKSSKQILPISLYVSKGEFKRLMSEFDEYRKD